MSAMRWRPRPTSTPRRAPRVGRRPARVAAPPAVHTAQLQGRLPEGAARHLAQKDGRALAQPAATGAGVNLVLLLFVLAVVGGLVAAWQGLV